MSTKPSYISAGAAYLANRDAFDKAVTDAFGEWLAVTPNEAIHESFFSYQIDPVTGQFMCEQLKDMKKAA